MAKKNISKIQLPSGEICNIKDTVSGYTKNTGTVTSVGISNATNGGLSVSGSPITSSGTISVGHSNILTSAQNTQGLYPITIDKNGHIGSYGNAITVPTKTSDLTNDSGFITDTDVFIAEINTTTYAEVAAAITAGKDVLARTTNSYNSYNYYPYTYAGDGQFIFGRLHMTNTATQSKMWTLSSNDVWSSDTHNLMAPLTTISADYHVAAGYLTSSAGTLSFTVPVGIVAPNASDVSINTLSCRLLARAGNSNSTGSYCCKANSSDTSIGASFTYGNNFSFYNANGASKSIAASAYTVTYEGNGVLYFNLPGGTDAFSGTSTIRGYINNQPVVVGVIGLYVKFDVS